MEAPGARRSDTSMNVVTPDGSKMAATMDQKLFVVGQAWSGVQEKISNRAACSGYVPKKTLSLQVTAADYAGDLSFVGSAQHGDDSYACIVQSGFKASYYEGSSDFLIETDNSYSPYNKCTKGQYEQPYGWAGSLSADKNTITSNDSMMCTKLTLNRVMGGSSGASSSSSSTPPGPSPPSPPPPPPTPCCHGACGSYGASCNFGCQCSSGNCPGTSCQ